MTRRPISPLGAVGYSILVLGLLSAGGCLSRSKARIHGKVTLDGRPLEAGALTFLPTDGRGQTAGAEIKDGEYTAEVSPGSWRVEVRSPKVSGQRKLFDSPDSPTQDVWKESVPSRYNSESTLIREVEPGSHEMDFELDSHG